MYSPVILLVCKKECLNFLKVRLSLPGMFYFNILGNCCLWQNTWILWPYPSNNWWQMFPFTLGFLASFWNTLSRFSSAFIIWFLIWIWDEISWFKVSLQSNDVCSEQESYNETSSIPYGALWFKTRNKSVCLHGRSFWCECEGLSI